MRKTIIAPLAIITIFACLASAADLEHLRPAARWLATERLKGILFHHTNIQPAEPMQLAAAHEGAVPEGAPVVLRGEHFVLIAPQPGRPIRFRLKTVAVRAPFESSSYAVFNAGGNEIGNGVVPAGEERLIDVEPRGGGPRRGRARTRAGGAARRAFRADHAAARPADPVSAENGRRPGAV